MAVRTENGKYLSRTTGPNPAIGAKTCWMRRRASSGDYGHVWVESWTLTDFNGIVVRDDGGVIIQSEQADAYTESASLFTVTNDLWYFLAWTYDGTTSKLRYLASGASVFAGNVTITPVHTANPWDLLTIGKGFGALYFDGEVAAPKIWSGAAPSDAELLAERQYRNPLYNLANVWATYQLKSGALGVDSSGNSRTLTETGAPAFAADPVDILGDDPAGIVAAARPLYAPNPPAGALQ